MFWVMRMKWIEGKYTKAKKMRLPKKVYSKKIEMGLVSKAFLLKKELKGGQCH